MVEINEYIVFALAQDKSPAEVTLRSADWAVITQVDGHKTIGEIAEALAFSIEEAITRFTWLYDKGLIKYVGTANSKKRVLPESFFAILESELTKIIGPVAPLVIEEVIWGMDAQRNAFDADNTAALIEAVGEEIPNEKKKLLFQQNMLKILKELETT